MTSALAFFKNQFYDNIRKQCRLVNEPFVDHTFPPSPESISPTGIIPNLDLVVWKRPSEICENPCLFVDGISTRDVCQGQLGNCWFVSSMAVLALHQDCLNKVIPFGKDQELLIRCGHKSAGIFQFRFWRYGEWVEVVVDDFLPTKNGKLMFAHSKVVHEFWSALLEKAYAKICGSYECLIGGQEEEALVDFSGGIPEQIFDLKKYADNQSELENLFKLLDLDYKNGSMLCTSIASKSGETEGKLSNGLVTTHAYSITKVTRLLINDSEGCMMIRIRNPWGEKEWNGPFCDTSEEWKQITAEEKSRIRLKIENDGEFWMPMQDYSSHFNQLTIVRQIKTGVLTFNANWYGVTQRGCWTTGCLDREAAIRGDDGGEQCCIDICKPGGDVVLVHLLQKCHRMMDTYLALLVVKVEQNRQTALHSTKWGQIALEYRLGGSRAICLRYRLGCGRYILKPYPTQQLKENKPLYYILRCYTTQDNHGFKLTSEPSYAGQCCRASKSTVISRLRIMQCVADQSAHAVDASKLYCEIKCENQLFKTNVCTNAKELIWDDTFLFYRSNLDIPIIVNIVERGLLMNSKYGSVIYQFNAVQLNTPEPVICTDDVLDINLKGPCKIIKCLKTQWYHTDDLNSL